MRNPLIFAINCFGAGVFFALIGCRLDASMATHNPAWMDVLGFAALTGMAITAISRRAS